MLILAIAGAGAGAIAARADYAVACPDPEASLSDDTRGPAVEKRFITAEGLLRDSFALAAQILASGFRPTFLVALWRGGAPIGIAVQEFLEHHGVATDHVAIRTSAYAGIDQQAKTVRVHGIDYLVSRLSFEDRLLLIDDVFDSGRSLEAVVDELARRCRRNRPGQVKIATAYFKPARNRSRLVPDYYVHRTDQWLVFPHELQGLSDEEIRLHKSWALPGGGATAGEADAAVGGRREAPAHRRLAD